MAEILTFLLILSAGDYDRSDVVVRVPCRAADLGQKAEHIDHAIRGAFATGIRLALQEAGTGEKTEAQWDSCGDPTGNSGQLVFIARGKTPKGTERRFTLRLEGSPGEGSAKITHWATEYFEVANAGKPVLRYNWDMVRPPGGKPSDFDRACYFHPLWAPCGEVLTGDFHPDHAHHRGLWFAWSKLLIGDIKANFWEVQEHRGTLRNDGFMPFQGPVFAGFWCGTKGYCGDKAVFKGADVTRVYSVPQGPWIADLTVRQEAIDADVVIEKLHYGGLAFRGRDEWNGKDAPVELLTSEGKTRRDANGTPARWVDFAGPFPGGKSGGILVIESRANPRYPNRLRVHPTMPFFSSTLVVGDAYTIKKGEPLVLNYRLILHDGKLGKDEAERFAADFASPPAATLKRGE